MNNETGFDPNKPKELETVVVSTMKKHSKLLIVLAVVAITFATIYLLTKEKPST